MKRMKFSEKIENQGEIDKNIEMFKDWLNSESFINSYAKGTIKSALSSARMFLEFLSISGLSNVSYVNAGVIRQYAFFLKKNGRVLSTITQRVAMLALFMDYCLYTGQINENGTINPVESYRLEEKKRVRKGGRKAQRKPSVLQKREQSDLISQLLSQSGKNKSNERNAAIAALILDTGLRFDEASNLTISQGQYLIEYNRVRVVGKGNKERVVEAMTRYKDTWSDFIENIRLDLEEEEVANVGGHFLFFGMDKGYGRNPVTQPSFWKIMRKSLLAIGVNPPQSGPHILRHTAASMMMAEGMNLKMIQTQLGHENLTTTEHYIHSLDGAINFE